MRKPKRLPPSVYLAFFTVVAKRLRAAGFETLPAGGILTRQEMDRLDEWCERGESADAFGDWLIVRRQEERNAEAALADQMFGNETISPKDVAA